MKNQMRHKQKGIASVEFAVGFGAFFLLCITWIEIGYLAHVSAVTDVAIAEAAREAKVASLDHGNRQGSPQSFMRIFKHVVTEETERYGGLVDNDKFRFTVQYLDSVDDLERYQGDCRSKDDTAPEIECGRSKHSALALYAVEYDYTPIFSNLIADPSVLRREVIVIQEYERDAFAI